MTIDLEELAAVIRLLKDADFSEFNYSRGDTVLQVRRGELTGLPLSAPVAAAAPAPAPAAPAAAPAPAAAVPVAPAPAQQQAAPPATTASVDMPGLKVRTPLLGTFYSAAKPGEKPFVRVGDRVEPDTVVCIVEVMKLMNSITAGVSGVVAAMHARDGDLVEHDQVLFTVVEAA